MREGVVVVVVCACSPDVGHWPLCFCINSTIIDMFLREDLMSERKLFEFPSVALRLGVAWPLETGYERRLLISCLFTINLSLYAIAVFSSPGGEHFCRRTDTRVGTAKADR